jgi:hypothetical protein
MVLMPTQLNRRIDYGADVDHVDGRKIYVWARSRDADMLLAEAEIVFVAPRGARRHAEQRFTTRLRLIDSRPRAHDRTPC